MTRSPLADGTNDRPELPIYDASVPGSFAQTDRPEYAATNTLAGLPEWIPAAPFGDAAAAIAADPLRAHVDAYRAHGAVYRVRLRSGEAVALAGIEANAFVWANSGLWDYYTGRAYFREQLGERYLSALDGTRHRHKRRQMQAGFRNHTLLEGAGRLRSVLDSELAQREGHVDLRRLCKRLVVCMASRALVQVDLPAGFEDQIAAFEHELLAGSSLGAAHDEWYRRPEYRDLKQRVLGGLEAVLERRADEPPVSADAFSRILAAVPASTPAPSRQELLSDLAMLLLAGSESTAHAILWALMYVYHRPQWLERLRVELDGFDPRRITDEARFPVLNAVAREVERLRPPFPSITLIAAEAFAFGEAEVPAGSLVVHPISLCHFLEEIFPEPWEFRPQRWLDSPAFPKAAIGLFGGGVHLCLGLPLARIELALALAVFSTDWEVAFDVPPSFKYVQSGALSPVEATLPVMLTRRNR